MGKEITIEILREVTERFIEAEPGRLGSEGWWQQPLVVTASIDQRFDQLPDIAYHKHLGYLTGLGRFGVHRMLITPAGCTGRFGSLVTEAELGNHPLIETEEACLLKAGQECGKCIEACPVQALNEDDFDRRRCWDRLNENRSSLSYFSDLPETTHVCAKCAAIMPCSFKNPVAGL